MPHSRRLTPEATDDDRERDSRERNPSNNDNDDPSPPVASRRDENSISFRHFLQPHSDVVPSRHRSSRGPNSGSIDLVDGVAMALPDFVQDHLDLGSGSSSSSISASGMNSMGNGELLGATSLLHHSTGAGTGSSPLDLAPVASASLSVSTNHNHSHSHNHDFTTSQRNHSYLSKRNRNRHQESNSNSHSDSVSHSNGDVVPNVNSASSSHSQQGPVALPDFLSDGPMLCSTNNPNSHGDVGAHLSSSTCSSPRRTVGTSSGSRASNSSRDSSESLPHQLDRLRRELAEKNQRLSLMESDLARQRSESSMFKTAYLDSEQGLQAATRRALAAEARVAELNNELQFFKNQLSERMTHKRNAGNSSGTVSSLAASASHSQPSQNSLPGSSSFVPCRNGPNNSNLDSNRVMKIAFSAEFLVGELMEQLDALKKLAVSSTAVPASKEKEAEDENTRVNTANTSLNSSSSNTSTTNSSSTNATATSKDKSKSKDGSKISK